jgi:DNA-binding response OmpR family regulator
MNSKKILLVDDANTILMIERMILARSAYQLITACDGEEAVAKALAERPDLILLDVVMPKMNGFQVLRELRRNETTRDIPIIMVTTRGEEQNMETGFTNGCTDYVVKPIDAHELVAKVRNYLGE